MVELVPKVHKVIKDNLELTQVKVHKELQVHKVLRVLLGQQVLKVEHQPMQFLNMVLLYGLVQQTQFQMVGHYVMDQTVHQI